MNTAIHGSATVADLLGADNSTTGKSTSQNVGGIVADANGTAGAQAASGDSVDFGATLTSLIDEISHSKFSGGQIPGRPVTSGTTSVARRGASPTPGHEVHRADASAKDSSTAVAAAASIATSLAPTASTPSTTAVLAAAISAPADPASTAAPSAAATSAVASSSAAISGTITSAVAALLDASAPGIPGTDALAQDLSAATTPATGTAIANSPSASSLAGAAVAPFTASVVSADAAQQQPATPAIVAQPDFAATLSSLISNAVNLSPTMPVTPQVSASTSVSTSVTGASAESPPPNSASGSSTANSFASIADIASVPSPLAVNTNATITTNSAGNSGASLAANSVATDSINLQLEMPGDPAATAAGAAASPGAGSDGTDASDPASTSATAPADPSAMPTVATVIAEARFASAQPSGQFTTNTAAGAPNMSATGVVIAMLLQHDRTVISKETAAQTLDSPGVPNDSSPGVQAPPAAAHPGEVAALRPSPDLSAEAARSVSITIALASGQTAQATVRERAGAVDVKILTPTAASAQRVTSEMDSLRQNFDAAGIKLGQADISYQQGDGAGQEREEYRPPQSQPPANSKEIFLLDEVVP
jgi:hypothetical protein